MPNANQVDRPALVTSILSVLSNPNFRDTEEGEVRYLFEDVFVAGDTYEVYLFPYECGADQETMVTYNQTTIIYEGSFQGNVAEQVLRKVAEHIADEFIRIGGCMNMFLQFLQRADLQQAG